MSNMKSIDEDVLQICKAIEKKVENYRIEIDSICKEIELHIEKLKKDSKSSENMYRLTYNNEMSKKSQASSNSKYSIQINREINYIKFNVR